MNALITLDQATLDLEKQMQTLRVKAAQKEEILQAVQVGGIGGVIGSIVLAVPELCDMDCDYSLKDSLLNAVLGFAVGAGTGVFANEASFKLFVGRRTKELYKSIAKLEKSLNDDYLVVKESYGNIFESYADGFQIEREIYETAFEIEKFGATVESLMLQKTDLEAEVKRLSDAMLSMFGHSDQTMSRALSSQKETVLRELDAIDQTLRKGESQLNGKDAIYAALRVRYITTLANRTARDKFGKLFLEGIAKDLAYLKGVAEDKHLSGRDLVRHQKAVEAIKVHHHILIGAYKEISSDLDAHREKATSSINRIRNSMRGNKSVDMTYASAPFWKSFFIATSLTKTEIKGNPLFDAILEGAKDDFLNARTPGDWLIKQAYEAEDLSDAVFTKDDWKQLAEYLVPYFEEGITSMNDFDKVNKAYKKFVMDKHSDTSGDGDDELIAIVSTLMRKLRVHTKEKNERGEK